MKTTNENLPNVVIPTKNRSDTIKFSLETIFQKDYSNFRIIVSDNNSTDNTQKIIKEFNDERIKYFFHNEDISMKKHWEYGFVYILKNLFFIIKVLRYSK